MSIANWNVASAFFLLPLRRGGLLVYGFRDLADNVRFLSDGFIEERLPDGQTLGYQGFLQRLEVLGERNAEALITALFAASDAALAGTDDPGERDDRTLVLITAVPATTAVPGDLTSPGHHAIGDPVSG